MEKYQWWTLVILILAAGFLGWGTYKSNLYRSYAPPESVFDIHTLLKWLDEPDYVIMHTVNGQNYFEVTRKIPTWLLLTRLSAGPPSYTVNGSGQLIGWSPDNGDYHIPEVLDQERVQREVIGFSDFISKFQYKPPLTDPDAPSNAEQVL